MWAEACLGRRLFGGLVAFALAVAWIGHGNAAPPRSIADVTAVLDRYKPDAAKLEAMRQKADAAPPGDLNDQKLAEFLFERSQAAAGLGRREQTLADARDTVASGRRGNHPALTRFIQYQATTEEDLGNLRVALDLQRERLRTARTPPQQLTAQVGIASVQLRLGSFGDAERSLQAAEALIERVRAGGASDSQIMAPIFQANVDSVRTGIAVQSGRLAGAEPLARRVLARFNDARRNPAVQAIGAAQQVQEDVYQRQYLNASVRLTRLLTKLGRLTDAETEARSGLNEALALYGRYSPLANAAVLLLAQVVYEQGRYGDAATLSAIAVETFRQLGAGTGSFQLAEALMIRARVAHNLGDHAAALAAFEEARALFPRDETLRRRYVEDEPAYGNTLLALGRSDAALPVLQRVATDRQRQFGDKNILTAEARAYYAVALTKTGQRRAALDEFREATQLLNQASRRIDDETSGADRDRRLRQINEAYMELLVLPPPGPGQAQAGGRPPGARGQPGNRPPSGSPPASRESAMAAVFRLSDATRSRGVLRALNASALRARITNPEQAELVRREQDAQKQIAAQSGVLAEMLASPAQEQDAETVHALRVAIDQLRDERAALRQQLEQRFPNYANLIDPRPADPVEIQPLLQPNEALLSIYVGSEKTFVSALRRDGAVRIELIDMGEKEVTERVAHLRKALDPTAATLEDIPAFDVAAAHDLYMRLIGPVAEVLAGADSLIVVPDKALGQLPFGLLVTAPAAPPGADAVPFAGYRGVPFLIRQMAVSQLPAISSLRTLRSTPRGAASRRAFAGFGDPWFNPQQAREGQMQMAQAATGLQTRGRALVRRSAPATLGLDAASIGTLPRLPETADEVRAIAAALRADAGDVFVGAAASEQAVKAMDLSSRKVVMFATHGLIPGDLDGLDQPALAMSAPGVVPGDEDGLLTMEEIMALRLDADWVVLSACNTGAANGAGAEAASGLGRAFFYAGTRAVLLTNWPVETNSARDLTTDLFRRQADNPNLSRAVAMQQAMLGLIDGPGLAEGGRSVFSYAHPIFWAPFSVIGDGGV
jgi:CHAT domain-containing protein/tetratricopeptide (TPR) repeat protein